MKHDVSTEMLDESRKTLWVLFVTQISLRRIQIPFHSTDSFLAAKLPGKTAPVNTPIIIMKLAS